MYRIGFIIFISAFLFSGCDHKEMASKYLTDVSVVRESGSNAGKTSASDDERGNNEAPKTPLSQPVYTPRTARNSYYIIVASYIPSERARAEKLVNGLKAKGYPAQILDAKGRLRVSIESFPTEEEARVERDRYRELTDRQDIWILKTAE